MVDQRVGHAHLTVALVVVAVRELNLPRHALEAHVCAQGIQEHWAGETLAGDRRRLRERHDPVVRVWRVATDVASRIGHTHAAVGRRIVAVVVELPQRPARRVHLTRAHARVAHRSVGHAGARVPGQGRYRVCAYAPRRGVCSYSVHLAREAASPGRIDAAHATKVGHRRHADGTLHRRRALGLGHGGRCIRYFATIRTGVGQRHARQDGAHGGGCCVRQEPHIPAIGAEDALRVRLAQDET
mmetsp:Transcript_99914/g.285630  ORF Transcript_99914/g.285630 Transcript_99914/m.285630 type:complete len:242 (-) Transcript_99914:602-1327(-)